MAAVATTFTPDSSVVAEVRPSPNHGERANLATIDMILIHYTGMADTRAAIEHLCSPSSEVSAHYIVLESGFIIQSVPESRRAWHAGASQWAGETDINSCSIGIELANPGHDHGYPDYPKRQIAALITLCRGILKRHRIPPHRVLGHSDVAPTRKVDPGEKFPWRLLADSGIGLCVKKQPHPEANARALTEGDANPAVAKLQADLSRYGYATASTGNFNALTRDVVAAFQRHFRQEKVDGVADGGTRAMLRALLELRDAAYGGIAST